MAWESSYLATVDETARRGFEACWRSGEPPSIDNYLPAPDAPRFLATLEELTVIDLEMRWKTAHEKNGPAGPHVEEYLARFPQLHRPEILRRLLKQEYLVRHRHGDQPSPAEYTERFPHLNELADEWTLAGVEAVEGALPQIPGYEILERLGRGGMGVVYKARHRRLNRLVALKMVLAGAHAGPEQLLRFQAEAEAIAQLQHPNIVQIYEINQHDNTPFLALEYLDCGSLDQKLRGSPVTNTQAARLVEILARAVQAAHQRGIVHRDLKPANILLSGEGRGARGELADSISPLASLSDLVPKITDFGLAKRVEGSSGLTESGAILGTPSYMAPEQAAGDPQRIGPAADVYALGAILYELLTGRPPFRAATPLDTIQQVRTEEAVPPRRLQPQVSRDLDTICRKCLEKDPQRRYLSAGDLADDLARFLAGEPIRARPVGGVGRFIRWCRRKPVHASLWAALAMLVVGTIAGLFIWQRVEYQHRQEALESQHRREAEASQRRARIGSFVTAQQDLARGELRADRVASAYKFLQQTVDRLGGDPENAAVLAPLRELHDRVGRLLAFQQLADKAERLAFFESDDNAARAAAEGLRRLGVLDSPGQWWQRLPSADLTPEQARVLHKEIHHQLIMLAGMRTKAALMGLPRDEAAKAYRSALELLKKADDFEKAQSWPESVSARVLKSYCHLNLGEISKMQSLRGRLPATASDCYFLGMAYQWMAQDPNDAISRATRVGFRLLGLDLGEPAAAAQELLRQAAAQEPRRYWNHLWLGWALNTVGDFRGAELAFTTCVSLRPEEALGFAERGRAVASQVPSSSDTRARNKLAARAVDDLNRAVQLDSRDYVIHLVRLEALATLGRHEEALTAAAQFLEWLPPKYLLLPHLDQQRRGFLDMVRAYLEKHYPVERRDAEVWSLLAALHLALGQDAPALQAADRCRQASGSIRRSDALARTKVIQAVLALHRKEQVEALAQFTEALELAPKSFRAAAGRARTLELLDRRAEALRAYEQLLTLAEADWQRLAAHLGMARVFTRLERPEEARRAWEQAREIEPAITEAQVEKAAKRAK
jgi:serine/threonine protein kinase